MTATRLLGYGVALLLLGASLSPLVFFSACELAPYNRTNNPDVTGVSLVPYSMRTILVENCVQLYWVVGSPPVVVVSFVRALLTVAAMAMSRDWWMIVYYALFYPAWLTLEYFKKHVSADRACASHLTTHGNGISGHMFYFLWALSTAFLQPALPTPRSLTLLVLLALFTWQGALTVLYGYHSLRQCVLGAGLGLLWASVSWIVTAAVRDTYQRRQR